MYLEFESSTAPIANMKYVGDEKFARMNSQRSYFKFCDDAFAKISVVVYFAGILNFSSILYRLPSVFASILFRFFFVRSRIES